MEKHKQLVSLFGEHGLIAQSLSMLGVFQRAVQAIEFSDLPVLLLGETGTGKQLLAEAVHQLDRKRSGSPCRTLNCSSISKTLAESELFGHTKGAFSGAESDRLGLFRSAHGGTVILDEIAELDLKLQPKLLRVLQEGLVLPVGSDQEQRVDVRVIAATNRPLEQMVATGRFRADLYQRLNVFPIQIPPLRERPEDLEVQARHFLSQRQKQPPLPSGGEGWGEGRVTGLSPRVLELLRLLPWEGNTRQLDSLMREILAHQPRGPLVELEDLPRSLLHTLADLPPRPSSADPPQP
ncbi:MAG: sigma 54-interacting transcriptional regulator [Planctomycetes bacterium]|nr:sigma 54-interacting transcriptional regulator [Planctomycetota bacterium]